MISRIGLSIQLHLNLVNLRISLLCMTSQPPFIFVSNKVNLDVKVRASLHFSAADQRSVIYDWQDLIKTLICPVKKDKSCNVVSQSLECGMEGEVDDA